MYQLITLCKPFFFFIISFVVFILANGSSRGLFAQTPPSGLVAAYGFSEGSGSTTADASGNSNTGTISGATWTTSGRYGNALSFNGSSSCVNINDANSLDLSNGMTLEAWVYPTTLNGWRTIILKEISGGLVYGLYGYDNAPRPATYINTGGNDLSALGTTSIPLNTWTYLAATYDGTTLRLFVNGSQVGNRTVSGAIRSSTNPLRIGGNAIWGEYFSGRIDEVRIYNRALSQAEIQTDMNTAISPTTPDTTIPTVTAFTIPSTATSLTVPITSFTATDNVGVNGHLVTESATAPLAGASGWSATAPASYSFATAGTKTLYAWAKDAANNVSTSRSASVTITLPDTTLPTVTAFTIPSTATSLTVPITSFTATDNVGVNGHLVTESATAPLAGASGWSATAPASYSFATAGTKTLYAWAKDAANNVSTSRSASVVITLPDTTAPTVTAFTIPSTATSLTVPITSFTATDNVGVNGHLVTESATAPLAGASGWSATAPASYSFATAGTKTLYAWAKDAANNVSTSRSASVTITLHAAGPEPAGWYAGDMHVHRSCGGPAEAVSSLYSKMSTQNLAVISLLADMGNGEVQNPVTDLPLVTGGDDPISNSERIVHWDAEWHWDAVYNQYPHQALGGHVVALGLSEADQIWEEYTYPIFEWARQQNAIAGFVHMQYLDNNIPQTLDCCTPIEYPVEVALGSADFIAQDVHGSDTAVQAYYRLLNTGFRPSFVAGTDYPCGVSELGSLLTYAQVTGGVMTYGNWIDGIKNGKTVVSRNGHNEFLNLVVNNTATPGHEINLPSAGSVPVTVTWTANQNLSGTIELVHNGIVVASKSTSVTSTSPDSLTATVNLTKSGWLAARRMDSNGHVVHTGAVFVIVNGAPIRASAEDANFYVDWMDNLLTKTSVGGEWNSYFPNNLAEAQARYQAAKTIYQQRAVEAQGPLTITTASLPNGTQNVAYSAALAASGGTTPYTWSIASGSLPNGLSLNASTGVISGTPTSASTFNFTARVTDAGNPVQNTTKALSITVAAAPTSYTIWSNSATPAILSDSDTGAVELGLKFRTDTAGTITGIRFYKAAANTGTHVGNLWSATGTLLGSVTFANETASGWQQMTLATPVSIQANTTYVVSYHTNVGRYSANLSYFTTSGVDSGPLHALAAGVDGPNGVYRYGSTSAFPDQTWQSANYWVDVVFSSSAPAPTLSSIAVTPVSPSVQVGGTQQFTATGTYSDGSTQNITSLVTWASSNTGAATITSAGLATAVSPGSSTISATLSAVTGSTTLTVQPIPLTITTASLPNGTQNVAYSAALAASGGTTPYTWSIASGSLPNGLSLNASTGVISGTPTSASTFNFTARVTDAGNPVQNTTKALSITVAAAPPTLSSIAVTPVSPSVQVGGTQQFTATGTYSDGSTQNITSLVTWASSNTGAATITSAGLATAVSPGSSTISATLSAVTGSTTLTVQPIPLTITTASLPNGTQNVAYSAALAASGGTTPYTWSIASGSLPNGLSLNASTGVISGTPTSASTFNFTARVTDAGNPVQNTTKALSITVAAAPTSYTIWSNSATPAILSDSDTGAVELGLKFRTDTAGTITGIRFYKAAANTGTHVGNLWSATGTLLGSVTFANETASGWQQMTLATPVSIQANTTYVVSYHTNVGRYSANLSYFTTSGVDSGPLHALAAGVDGPNGVYRYGSTSAFPDQTWQSANYWVDVVFSSSAPAPTLSSIAVTPVSPSVQVGGTQQFTATGTYSDGSTQNITSLVTWASSNTGAATITSAGLATAVSPGSSTISATLSAVTGSTTLTATVFIPPNEGPGGPILVISSSSNPFSRYYAEILRTEGLNAFFVMDISGVSAGTLTGYDTVILGEMALTGSQVTMLTDWVNAGGNLIAMRPDKQLASLLGLTDASTTLSNAYLLMNTASEPGQGLVNETIQFHGTADRYTLNGATAIATLYSSATQNTSNSAVTLRSVGSNGGQAAAFTYDLAKSVVYTRQGNPAWSGEERDMLIAGDDVIRSNDLFYGAASWDPQPDWINLDKVAIPQADEQQRLLANLIIQMTFDKKPLPRFWYFPRSLEAVVIMTGDDHDGETAEMFDSYIGLSSSGCSVQDWECVRSTTYLTYPDLLGPSQASYYAGLGFEVALHVNTSCANWTPSSLAAFYADQLSEFGSHHPSLSAPVTERTHCIVWSDYVTQPQVQLNNGIRLDTNYYYWPGDWVNNRPGFFTGSGMPMRFASTDGTLIDVYQAVTQMTDESGQAYPFTIDELLDNAIGPQGYYGAFTANMHNDNPTSTDANEIVYSAQARGIPVISARQMLEWLDGRNSSTFSGITWNGTNTLTFTISTGQNTNGIMAMVPILEGRSITGITRNGSPVSYTTGPIKGIQYVFFYAETGSYQVIFGP